MLMLALLMCALMLGVAVWRVWTDGGWHAWGVLAVVGCYATVFVMGVLRYCGVLAPVDDGLTTQSMSYVPQFLSGQLVSVVGGVFVLLHAFVAWAVWSRMGWIRFVACIVGGFLVAGVALGMLAGSTPLFTEHGMGGLMAPVYSLFGLCCATMAVTGWALGLTYAEFWGLGNNWLQLGLVVASALWVLWQWVRSMREHPSRIGAVGIAVAALLALAYVALYVAMFRHYPLSLNAAFHACVSDLYGLADMWGTSYYVVNILIYIIAFLGALCANAATIALLRNPSRRVAALVLVVLHLAVFAVVWLRWPAII